MMRLVGEVGPEGRHVRTQRPKNEIKDQGSRTRIKDQGSSIGPRIQDQGSRFKDQGSRVKDKDQGSRTKDEGSRIMELVLARIGILEEIRT